MNDLMTAARQMLSARLRGTDVSAFDDEVVRDCVGQMTLGGWDAFAKEFADRARSVDRVFAAPSREELSPVKLKIKVEHWLSRKLREFDTIESATFADDEVKIVVSIAKVDRRSRRDIVTERITQLHVWEAIGADDDTKPGWKRQRGAGGKVYAYRMIDITEAVDEQHVRWGAINTPERDASIRDQVETCYRPGSSKSPMRGWAARAEMSWKQAHEGESFQIKGHALTNVQSFTKDDRTYHRYYCECGTVGGKTSTEQASMAKYFTHVETITNPS